MIYLFIVRAFVNVPPEMSYLLHTRGFLIDAESLKCVKP